MASKLIVFAAALVACHAVPLWYTENYVPTVIFREARAPSIAYGFGSGFSSNIGGISQSNGLGVSFNTGDGEAYGAGIGSSDGNIYANGVGIAHVPASAPEAARLAPYPLRYSYTPNYSRNNYATPVQHYATPIIQNYARPTTHNYGTALAQTHNGPYSTAASASQNGRYQSALTTSQNRGYNQGGAVATANSGYSAAASSSNAYGGTAISSAQSRDADGGLNYVVTASENSGDYRASTAQTVQQRGNAVQQSGATSIEGPGIQASHSHAIKTGYY